MPQSSPIAAGFRTAIRRPAVFFGEIAWRWAFGAAAWGLLLLTLFAYLESLTITDADWLLLRTKAPPLMAEAVRHILSGSGPRLLRAAAILLPALAAMWIVAASFARWASLRALIEQPRGRFRTVLGLHFLRAAGGLAAWIGYLGALLIAGFAASRDAEDHPGLFLLIFFVLAAVVGFFHGWLRWYLFLANILAVRDGSDAFSAIAAAFDTYRRRRARFLALAAAMGGIRLFLLIGVTIVSLVPVSVVGSAWKLLAILLVLITLAYFLIADFLFVARLAAYIDILRDEPEPEPASTVPAPSRPSPESVLASTHDPQPMASGPTTDDREPTTALEASS
ncbi:MAG TPA: hypothetical protein VMS96_01520 [Terriglobales bacterium]|nr:hypothetical protein [Terriglobales bacterium]